MEPTSNDRAFVNELIHAETKRKYDPIKRREYYLKTRQLKGRKKAGRSATIAQKRKALNNQLDKIENAVSKLVATGKKNTPQYNKLIELYKKVSDQADKLNKADPDYIEVKVPKNPKAVIDNVTRYPEVFAKNAGKTMKTAGDIFNKTPQGQILKRMRK